MRILSIILLTLLLATCTEETTETSSPIKQDFDRTRLAVDITVYWYDTQGQVDKVFRDTYGEDNPGREGFAVWPAESNDPWCIIHQLRPKAADDSRMDILGHETYHCLHGQFHD